MKRKTTLMAAMAACVLPLGAQTPDLPSGQIFRMLAEPDAAAELPLVRRERAFPVLAQIPADADAWLALNLRCCKAPGRLLAPMLAEDGGESSKLAQAVSRLDGAALCLGKGGAASLASLLPLWKYASTGNCGELAEAWAEAAQESLAPAIREQGDGVAGAKAIVEAAKSVPSIKIRPVYIILTAPAGDADALETIDEAWQARLASLPAEPCSAGGFRGVKLPGGALAPMIENRTGDAVEHALSKELPKRSLYLMTKRSGRSLAAVVCEDPSEISLPADAGSSASGSDLAKSWSAGLASGAWAAAYASPETLDAWDGLLLASASNTIALLQRLFTNFADEDEDNAPVYSAAARGAEGLYRYARSFAPAQRKEPSSFIIWQSDDTVEFKWTMDAAGARYEAGPLRLIKLTRAKGSVLYYESTPEIRPKAASFPDMLRSAADVAAGCLLSLKPDAAVVSAQDARKTLKSLADGLESLGAGLGGGSAFILDVGGKAPAASGGSPMPRAAYYSRVANRAELAQAWKTISSLASPLAGGSLPVESKPLKKPAKAVSMSVKLPFFGDRFAPNVVIDPDALAMGTSPVLNTKILAFDDGKLPFKGAVLAIRPGALAGSLAGLSGAMMMGAPALDAPSADDPADGASETEPASPAPASPAGMAPEGPMGMPSAALSPLGAGLPLSDAWGRVENIHMANVINGAVRSIRVRVKLKPEPDGE